MIVALASPRPASTLDEGLDKIERFLSEAAAQGAAIVCFPEAYLPGLRGQDFDVPPFRSGAAGAGAPGRGAVGCARPGSPRSSGWNGSRRRAGRSSPYVFDAAGEMQGIQTKNQLDPTEDRFYVPGNTRRLFEVNGVKFGVAICHEGWRYPETVRWAAVRGAKIVFHPQHTGSERAGVAADAVGRGRTGRTTRRR